jgi:type IV pilus assembly protein PilW
MSPKNRQHGYTLVELMISVVIGLFIIAGVFQIYLSSRAASNLQDRMSNVQENGRFALFFLQRSLRKAGFPKSSALNPFTSTPSDLTCPIAPTPGDCPANLATATAVATTTATCNGPSATTASDQFAVCYQGTTDCLGQAIASGVVTDFFYIDTDATTGVSRLMCRGSGNATAQPLVDGVQNMQVQYGIDIDGSGYANQYVRANEVTNWGAVVATRVSLLVSTNSNSETASGTVIGDTASDAQSYQILETTLPSTYLSSGIRGRVYTTTVELRNRTP